MTTEELLQAKLRLASMEVAQYKLAAGEKRVTVTSGNESVTYSQGNAAVLEELILRLRNRIELAEGGGRRPIHFV